MLVDPFRIVAIRERMTQVIWLCLLTALVCALWYFWFRTDVSDGRIVEAEVLRFETYSAPSGMGGDLPILTVQLPDGSTRQVRSSWAAVGNCAPGRWVWLQQRGTALQVGLQGCTPKH